MTTTRTLLHAANPVPEVRDAPLTPRARAELRALVPDHELVPSGRRGGIRLAVALLATAVVVLGIAVVVPLLRDAPGSSSVADYPHYATTAELEGVADLIVRGTFTAITPDDSAGYPRAIATVDVTASAKGPVEPGTTLEIAYTSAGAGERTDLEVGGEYVLLLDDLADLEGDWPPTPVNASQGFYTVVDGRAVPGPDNTVPLAPETLAALGLS